MPHDTGRQRPLFEPAQAYSLVFYRYDTAAAIFFALLAIGLAETTVTGRPGLLFPLYGVPNDAGGASLVVSAKTI